MTELNEEGIPGPGGRPWGDTTIRGQVDRGTGLLNNTLYIGRMEWNRCSYVKNPQTGKKVARVNPIDAREIAGSASAHRRRRALGASQGAAERRAYRDGTG
jgi:hypothetical protein